MSLGILKDLQYLDSGVGVILLDVGRSFGLTGKDSAIDEQVRSGARVLGFWELEKDRWKEELGFTTIYTHKPHLSVFDFV